MTKKASKLAGVLAPPSPLIFQHDSLNNSFQGGKNTPSPSGFPAPVVFPSTITASVVQPDKPKKRTKKVTSKLAVISPVLPSPELHLESEKNSVQNGKNTLLSPLSYSPRTPEVYFTAGRGSSLESPSIATGEVSADTLIAAGEAPADTLITAGEVSADTPIAIVCSDIHLSPGAPAARIEEPDWQKAMESQMLWLFNQAKFYNVPLVIAGDIFDRAIADSRFISVIIGLFRQCEVPIYAVPGNHDLPYHSYSNMSESAYGILMVTDSIKNIDQIVTYRIGNRDITLHGYYWARSFDNPPPFNPDHFNIAVIHKYVYDSTTGYFGADISGRYDNQLSTVRHNYDFLIYGDNHTPFHKTTPSGQILINCGSFFRRSQNDKHLKPAAYLLKLDRSFTPLHVPLEGQTFLQKDDTFDNIGSLPDYSELSDFFENQASGIDNLTIRDSFRRFVAITKPLSPVKAVLSRISGMSLES